MKLIELRVIFDADNIELAKSDIINLLYEFGISGVKIDEPMERNILDFYKNEKDFVTNEYAISAYFPNNPYTEKRKIMINEKFSEVFGNREDLIYNIDYYELDNNDYEDNWKKYVFTEKISDRFVVKPTWREYEPSDDELMIELDPGRAFGTGTHPTTYLCIQMMEKYLQKSDSVIDVGTGSGILMVAAEKLGASEIWGVDIDPDACEVAKENLLLNQVSEEKTKVFAGNLLEVVEEKKFSVVVANILADVILLLLDQLEKVVDKEGLVILSGIINDKEKEVVEKAQKLGLKLVERKEDKEWISLCFKR